MLLENHVKLCVLRLSAFPSPWASLHGGLHSMHPGTGRADIPCLSCSPYPSLRESARKPVLSSLTAGQRGTKVCITPRDGYFSMSRVHQCAPSRSLDRNKAPEDHWLCLLIDSPWSVWSHSKAASLPWPKWSHNSWPDSCFIAFHIIFASCCLWYQNS